MKITVSELLVRYLEHLDIDYIFGMPGAHILPVYDSLYDSGIHSILAKHEQGAAFMAGGYARASGKISACIATAGPGATNLITGIANAYADKQPVLVITGETSTHIFGKGGLQESSGEGGTIDQEALFQSITRYNKSIERTDYLAQVLHQASRILLSPNPGPVLLSFPYNVQKEMVDDSILEHVATSRTNYPVPRTTPPVEMLADRILAAKNPVIVAGFGCIRANAKDLVAELSESMNIPVATSLKGKGVVGEETGLSLGSLGVTSSGHAYRYIVEHADLVIVLGAGFNERTSYLWDDKLLGDKMLAQVDTDYAQLGKVFSPDIAIHGDIREVLSSVLAIILERRGSRGESGVIRQDIAHLKNTAANDYAIFQSGFSLAEKFFEKLAEAFPGDVMVFDDNIIFAQNFFNVSAANSYYPNSGISSLGHAIPAAIGARFARAQPTFAILGDGGFQMCCMEIMTAVNYQLPLNVVVFNNSSMGLIRKNQHQQYDQRFINCDFVNPDFRLLAQSFGISHRKIATEADVDEMFSQDDLVGSVNLIEIMIDKDTFPNYSSGR